MTYPENPEGFLICGVYAGAAGPSAWHEAGGRYLKKRGLRGDFFRAAVGKMDELREKLYLQFGGVCFQSGDELSGGFGWLLCGKNAFSEQRKPYFCRPSGSEFCGFWHGFYEKC